MASKQTTIDFLTEQCAGAGRIAARKMFGEYALYCDDTVFALVCDDQLYVKPTPAGRAHIGTVTEAAPYPGAKPHFRIDGETWDDSAWLTQLVRLTAAALPPPTKRKAR